MDASTSVSPSISTAPARLLVVDDHTEVVAAIQDYFQTLNYVVDTAYDGPSALDKVQQSTYDVILLDIVMPQIDGLTVCHRLKTDPRTTDTGIVVLTAVDKLDARLEALRNGADDYIGKPFSMKELELRVGLQVRATSYRREIQHALCRERRKTESLEIVADLAHQVTTLANGDIQALCEATARSLGSRFEYEVISIALINEQGDELTHRASAGTSNLELETGSILPLKEGIVAHVCRTGTSYMTNDTTADPYWKPYPLKPEAWSRFRSELCVPIKSGDRVLGCINIESVVLNAFEASDRLMLETLAGHIAVGLTNARMYREKVEQTTELAVQTDILGAINSTRDIQTLFSHIGAQITRVVPHHGLAVTRYQEKTHTVHVLYTERQDEVVHAGAEFPADIMPYTLKALQRNTPVYCNDIQADAEAPPDFRARLKEKGVQSVLLAPIQHQDHIFGAFILMHTEKNAFTDRDTRLIRQLTPHLALAVTQAEEYETLQRAYADLQEAQEARIQTEREKAMLDTALQTGMTLSHEINNPLTAIIGFSELLVCEHPDQSEYRIMLEAAQRIADVVRRLRQLKSVRLKSYVSDIPTQMIDLGLPSDSKTNDKT